MIERGANVAVVGLVVLTLDRKDGNALLDEGRRDVVLGGQWIARVQHGARAARLERKCQIRGLRGDVGANDDAYAVQWALTIELISNLTQHRHLTGGPLDSAPPFGG